MRHNASHLDLIDSRFQFTHPGRGATTYPLAVKKDATGFNSRTPGGVRPNAHLRCTSQSSRFNSRTPGGVRRQYRNVFSLRVLRFNSRTPGGVRPGRDRSASVGAVVSIHAPREGCDRDRCLSLCRGVVSIHAPREGCDSRHDDEYDSTGVSIHAPREGCDEEDSPPPRQSEGFNSRTPGGVRLE